jgi:hypothetical protein
MPKTLSVYRSIDFVVVGSLLGDRDRGDYAAKESSEIDDAKWSTAMAAHGGIGVDDNATRLGGTQNELSRRENGEVISLLDDDDDDDDDDDVVLVPQPASSIAVAYKQKMTSATIGKNETSSI